MPDKKELRDGPQFLNVLQKGICIGGNDYFNVGRSVVKSQTALSQERGDSCA